MHSYQIVKRGKDLDKASKALILLHGRGGEAEDILNIAHNFSLNDYFIAAPQATNSTWYPNSFLAEGKLNEPWLSSAIAVIKRLIDEIEQKIAKDRIYLMGFSQGACLSLEVSTRFASKYGGVVAFSGALIGEKLDRNKYSGNFDGTKVFIGVSENDPHIPLSRVKESEKIIRDMGAQVTVKVYEGNSHNINQDEINWVNKNIFTT